MSPACRAGRTRLKPIVAGRVPTPSGAPARAMNIRKSYLYALLGLAVIGILWRWNQQRALDDEASSAQENRTQAGSPANQPLPSRPSTSAKGSPATDAGTLALDRIVAQARLGDARSSEAVIQLPSADALRRFLERAPGSGLTILDRIDALGSVRVRLDSPESLNAALQQIGVDPGEVSANFLVWAPGLPPPEVRGPQVEVPFGDGVLQYLGAGTGRETWGQGIVIAILDSGIVDDPTFGNGRIRPLDVGFGIVAGDGHGTAVASLAAGAASDAEGIAPAATLLSVRVTDDSGTSDHFTLARAIVAAVDAGASIVNISMGGYQPSAVLAAAVDYAGANGAFVVASAGNDQAAQLTWPAALQPVVSVGAVDALGQQVSFSNSGASLDITAPGYGVNAAWTEGNRVSLSGTSASAPIVSGAIAAIMSQSPWLTAADAWQVLRDHVSEGGPIGADASFGAGILNVGSAISREDSTYADTAVASQYFEPATQSIGIVVQNRGNQPVTGLRLRVDFGGAASSYPIGVLGKGASALVRIPMAQVPAAANGTITLLSVLENPAGLEDANPGNNRRAGSLLLPGTP
jgi:hypothetical protein